MPLLEIVWIAFRNITHQKMRSYLTLLGIIIGVAAIVALVSVGEGLNKAVTSQFEQLGLNTVFVEPGSGDLMSMAVGRTIRETDIKTIERIAGVEHVAAFYEASGTVEYGDETASMIFIGIALADLPYLKESGFLALGEGRLFTPADTYAMIVPDTFIKEAFEKEIGLRQRVQVNGKTFKIVGITKQSDVAFSGFGQVSFAWVPKEILKEVFGQTDPVELVVLVQSREQVADVAEEIEAELEREHGEKDFSVMTSENILVSASAVIGLVSLVLIGIAAISLVVGGIGIMNTMVMAVMERTREIGIMKAIGATNSTVMAVFLAEAGLFGAVGGIIGAVLGFGIALGIAGIATSAGFSLPVSFSPFLALGAIGFALVVGIASGVYPARRAAALDPVEALRYE